MLTACFWTRSRREIVTRQISIRLPKRGKQVNKRTRLRTLKSTQRRISGLWAKFQALLTFHQRPIQLIKDWVKRFQGQKRISPNIQRLLSRFIQLQCLDRARNKDKVSKSPNLPGAPTTAWKRKTQPMTRLHRLPNKLDRAWKGAEILRI